MEMGRICLKCRYSLIRQPPRDFAEPEVDGSSSGWVETPKTSHSNLKISGIRVTDEII